MLARCTTVLEDARRLLAEDLEPRAAELAVQLRHSGHAELAAEAAEALRLYRRLLRELRDRIGEPDRHEFRTW